ncbi:MAG: alpha-galactosidase [Prolixibacteraceae bacterium]|jgi:alpha-galactosidase|nr:alpha-galactosidase [Prolixibacteraceae bacterium]
MKIYISIKKILAFGLLIMCFPYSSFSQITFDAGAKSWLIRSGINEYRLFLKDSSVYFDNFTPKKSVDWPEQIDSSKDFLHLHYDFSITTETQTLTSKDFYFISHKIIDIQPDVQELVVMFRGKNNAILVEKHYKSFFKTGVITKNVRIKNIGTEELTIEKLPSLCWKMPKATYDLTYMQGGGGKERSLKTETLVPGDRLFQTTSGRSTNQFATWFFLQNKTTGISYAADLAYSGNWEMNFKIYQDTSQYDAGKLEVSIGLIFDNSEAAIIKPGESLQTPEVSFTSTSGNIDDATNQLHAYQRQYVFPKPAFPMLVQFNSWYALGGNPKLEDIKKCVELAAEIGIEVFVMDAGWYNHQDWSREVGDWQVNENIFPKGLEELVDYVRGKGLKFGLWVEIENVGTDSKILKDHPDWVYTCNGSMVTDKRRTALNLNKPEVRQWMKSELNRLVKKYNLDWIKIDYNLSPGNCFDDEGLTMKGTIHYNNVLIYYNILDELQAENPNLIIENCASGGRRFDTGIMQHTHASWVSDEVDPLPSLALGYGANTQFSSEICNQWMVGDKNRDGKIDTTCTPDWFNFLLRVPMNGQFGISSRVYEWTQSMIDQAADQIKMYKEHIRPVIMGSDTYHLTQQPDMKKPEGWMAIQYVSPDSKKSIVMTYRLQNSEPVFNLKVRGLNPNEAYKILIEQKQTCILNGNKIMEEGISVSLDSIWSSAIVKIEQVDN